MKLYLALILYLLQIQLYAQFHKVDYTSSYRFTQEILDEITHDFPQWKYQIISTDFAKIEQDSLALLYWDKAMGARSVSLSKEQKDSIKSLYTIKDAKAVLIEEAKGYDLMIINEAHHINQHRIFTTSLLDSLYDQGYRYFGLEALTNQNKLIEKLNSRGYLTIDDGYYTQSPHFAELVNHALYLGFEIFAYEAQEGLKNEDREQGQADNIHAFMQDHRKGKYLIYCGYDHGMEGEHAQWGSAMAERLKQLSGLNPLTIDQVKFAPRYELNYKPALLQALEPQESIVIYSQGKVLSNIKGKGMMDIALMHPDKLTLGKKVAVEGINSLDLNFPFQLLVIPAGAVLQEAAAIAVKEYQKEQKKYYISLQSGKYQLLIRDQEMKDIAYLKNIEVD